MSARWSILAVLLWWLGSATAWAQWPEAVTLKATVEPAQPYEGQVFAVTIEVAFESAALERHAVPLFRSAVGHHFDLRAPWMDEIPGASRFARASPAIGAHTSTLVLNAEVVPATLVVDPAVPTQTRLRIQRWFVAQRAGEITLDAPQLTYARASRFQEDLLRGRVAVDRQEVRLMGAPVSLVVFEPPLPTMPMGYSGYVGDLSVTAEVDRSELGPGESLQLKLRLRGDGDLSLIPAHGPGDFPGFHLLGVGDRQAHDERTLTYELTPLDATTSRLEVPEIVIWRPAPGGDEYVRVPVDAIRIHVTPPGGRTAADPQDRQRPGSLLWIAGVVLLAACGALAHLRQRRRRRGEVAAAKDARRGLAREQLRLALQRPGADLCLRLEADLAALLASPVAAMSPEQLAGRLSQAGVPAKQAVAVAQAHSTLQAERFRPLVEQRPPSEMLLATLREFAGRSQADATDVRL